MLDEIWWQIRGSQDGWEVVSEEKFSGLRGRISFASSSIFASKTD